MSKSAWERNTSGLLAYAQRRKEEKQKAVEAAIDRLLRERQPINFNSIATKAGVTKAYLYSQPALRERIEALRQQAVGKKPGLPPKGKTDASKEVLLLAKDRRIKDLEAENRRLKEELRIARGKLYEQM